MSPSSAAISSDIGHGAAGARTGLRTIQTLLGESAGQRHVWIELRPGWLLSGTWTNVTGNSWTLAPTWPTFDGREMPPMELDVASGVLERAVGPGGVDATAGKFYWDGTTLRAHLPEDEDPNSETVVARLGVFVGTAGVVHPNRSTPERLTNGGLEDFTGAVPDGWTVGNTSGGTIVNSQTTDSPYSGLSALRSTFTAAASGHEDYFYQQQSLVAGWFEFSGYYRGDISSGAAIVRLFIYEAGGVFLQPDCLSLEAVSTGVTDVDAHTSGEWRHFSVTFKMPVADILLVRFGSRVTEDGTTGTVDFDKMSLRHIPSWEWHHPLLTLGGVPTMDTSRADAFYGPISTGLGSLTLANDGGALDALIADYDWINAPVIIRLGGRFAGGGNDVPLSDCPIFARGRITDPDVSDDRVVFSLEDQRDITQVLLPLDRMSGSVESRDDGRPRTVSLGKQMEWIRPTRVAVEANGLGTYEICDPSFTSAGEVSADLSVLAYLSEESADKRLFTDGDGLDETNDISFSGRTGSGVGRLTVLREIGPIRVDEDHRTIDFDIGGGALVARVAAGVRTTALTCLRIQQAMNTAAGVSDISVTLSTTTHKVSISRAAGTLNLLPNSGANRAAGLWGSIGFNDDADRTGGGPYVGDNALFEDTLNHVIRVRSDGVCDDSAGTYTGTAYQYMQYASELAHYILGAILRVPSSEINEASFEEARTNATKRIAAGIILGAGNEQMTVGRAFELIEAAGGADIRLDDGQWAWHWRETTAESDVVDIFDHEFLGFSAGYNPDDLVRTIILGADHDGVTGGFALTASSTSDEVDVRFARRGERFFPTAARLAGLVDVLVRIKAEAQTKRRRFRFGVKGKALLRPVGSQLRLSRDRGLDTTGALDAVLVRILSKRDDVASWVSDVEAIEVVDVV